MKYINTSEQPLLVRTATQPDGITVQPGHEILTSPVHAKSFVDKGQLEIVKAKQTRSPKKETTD